MLFLDFFSVYLSVFLFVRTLHKNYWMKFDTVFELYYWRFNWHSGACFILKHRLETEILTILIFYKPYVTSRLTQINDRCDVEVLHILVSKSQSDSQFDSQWGLKNFYSEPLVADLRYHIAMHNWNSRTLKCELLIMLKI